MLIYTLHLMMSEEPPKFDDCDVQLANDELICNGLCSSDVRVRCHGSAVERYGACKYRTFIPPLITK